MARRRLEFPDEFVLPDGTRVATPEELARHVSEDGEFAAGILERVASGEVERWLAQIGWGPASQRVAALREGSETLVGSEVAGALRGSSRQSSPSEEATPNSEEQAGQGESEESADSVATRGEPEHRQAGFEVPRALPSDSGNAPTGGLVEAQRAAIQAFRRLEETRSRAEKEAKESLGRQEAAIRSRAERTRSQAAEQIAEARDRSREAFEKLSECGIEWPRDQVPSESKSLSAATSSVSDLTRGVLGKIGALEQLRVRIRERNTVLKAAAVSLGALVLIVSALLWASRREDERRGQELLPTAEAPQGVEEVADDTKGEVAASDKRPSRPEPFTRAANPGSSQAIAPRSTTPVATAAPTPRPAVLEVRTNVYDDVVSVAGRVLGASPQVLELSAGPYVVVAEKHDCETARADVVLEAGQRRVVRLELDCVDAEDLVSEARGHFEAGEYDEALAAVAQALELSPGFEPALELRRRIEATKSILQGGAGRGGEQ